MRNVRVNERGDLCCWKCGSTGLISKRTTRSKVAVGVGALATKKKLKCQACGEYNDVGNAKPTASAKAAAAAARQPAQPVQQAPATVVGPDGRGWHPDPTGVYAQRFYDGRQWTQHVVNLNGIQMTDPDPIATA